MADKLWPNGLVVCIASGPSLSAADCELVRKAELPTIAVNSSYKLASFAQVVYGGDKCWWDAYGQAVPEKAIKVTCTQQAALHHDLYLHRCYGEYNSGMRAIQYAVDQGVSKVVLLGYDCSLKYGSHWHGDHQKTANPNLIKVKLWHKQFATVAAQAKALGVCVVNCSAYTELQCFPTGKLTDHLSHA